VTVAVHGLPVILSVAKNLAWNRGPNKILRYAQNDGVSPARERLPSDESMRGDRRPRNQNTILGPWPLIPGP
jgi:hypothetical protein